MRDKAQLELVQRIQAGDPAAEKEFFEIYQERIIWMIRRQIKAGKEELQDVASETCAALLMTLRKDASLPEKYPSLEAFIHGVTKHKIMDWFKKARKEKKMFDDDPHSEEIAGLVERCVLETEEMKKLVHQALAQLPEKNRQVLELMYLQSLSIKEIAAHMGKPERRISEWRHYGLKLLRKNLGRRGKASILMHILLLS